MFRWWMVWLLCAVGFPKSSSAFYIHLHGIVTEHFSGDALKGVQIRLVKDSVDRETVITGGKGEEGGLPGRGDDLSGWVYPAAPRGKAGGIYARKIPLFPDVPFFDMDLQMTMFTWIDGFDVSLYMEPVGRAEYKQSVRNLSWDVEHTKDFQTRSNRTMIHYEREVADRERKAALKGTTTKPGRRRRVVDF